MNSKRCSGCYITKPLNLFCKIKTNKDGYNGKCKKCIKEYVAYRKKVDPTFMEKARTRDRIRLQKMKQGLMPHRVEAMLIRKRNNNTIRAISKNKNVRNDTFLRLFGCSKEVFIERFERFFKKNPGMGWHNHGAWHMDHIKPLKDFDLETEASRKLCNHYTNLRPEWATFNIQKGAKKAGKFMYEVE